MSGEARTLFISCAHLDDAVLQEVKDHLRENGYETRDAYSDSFNLNEATNEHYFKHNILPLHLDWASVVLVLISPLTSTQPRVDWVIEYAQRRGKRIVGAYVQGGKDSNLPASFQMYGDALVGWKSGRVMDAIEGRIDTLLMPDGETEFPERDIDRFACGEPSPQ